MKETLQKAGLFAKSMNAYSYMLIKNPDVNFEGITINGYVDLPGKLYKIKRMQETCYYMGYTSKKTAFRYIDGHC